MQCPRCQRENRPGAKFCDGCGAPLHRPPVGIHASRSYTDLEHSLTEALEQQTATAEILRVISRTPTNAQPVFDTVAESATRLCVSRDAQVFVRDGELLRQVSHHGLIPISPTLPLISGTANGRAVLEGRTVHVLDMQVELNEYPEGSEVARRLGLRTILVVPLMRDGMAIGSIAVRRTEARFFTERQVALLQIFAAQAVIAIENARLFGETKEALEQQTATTEILRAISEAQTDTQPVFDAIARSTVRLCDGARSTVWRPEGELLRCVARYEMRPEGQVVRASSGEVVDADSLVGRAIRERQILRVNDATENPALPLKYRERARIRGYRSLLAVPMVREGLAVGGITVVRPTASDFSDQEVGLVQTFADQAVIAIENVRLFKELEARNRDLTESLEQQIATSEILRVISSSPTDVQPVFEAIAQSAMRLCDGTMSVVSRYDGELIHLGAYTHVSTEGVELILRRFPMYPTRGNLHGRVVLEGGVVHIPDVQADAEFDPAISQALRSRSTLGVPMLLDGRVVGAIAVAQSEVRPFTDKQIALLKTFANQAVIAIENVRLFKELQEKNRALTQAHAQVTETLEQQTATSEILRVISSSPTDVQPVFETIARSAAHLTGAVVAALYEYDGRLVHLRALEPATFPKAEKFRELFPRALGADFAAGHVILGHRVLHVADLLSDPATPPASREWAEWIQARGVLWVPLLRDDEAIGVISVSRAEAGHFPDDQVKLLQTFADQAVIAIENVRLLKELQTSNRDLTIALDKQTATSDILSVISRSQTDLQPVFDAIVNSAVRLLRGYSALVTRVAGDQIELAAYTSTEAEGDAVARATYPMPLQSRNSHGQAIHSRTTLNIADAQTDARLPDASHAFARARGFHGLVALPLLRHDEALGSIGVTRREPGGFADNEIALLKTFADQAVIAIENVRLFKELEASTHDLTRSVGELRALGEVGQAISSTLNLQTVLGTIVGRAVQLSGTDAGVIYEYDEQSEVFVPRATERLEAEIVATMLATPVRRGEGATGRLAELQEPIQVPDIPAAPAESRVRGALVRAGYRALLAVPLVREGRLLGGLTVIRKATGAFAPGTIELLRTFATQSSLAIQNARLFREIEDKSRQLEVASQHKSEFLANMSHELRTPLNAIIGFSEVLTDRMFGELNEKQEEYSKDIHASGHHLLSLINDILDLSKIEAGRMELELTDFDLPTAIENALMLIRERAGRRSVVLQTNIDNQLGEIHADERKVRQVVLNLLSNAIKFTPEGGRIDVGVMPKDGFVEVSVSDTGIGIAPEDQEKVFEEFRQVGTAAKKIEGTGLGLTLCRKFVELHGGRIWVTSQLGQGSTFTFTIPVRAGE